MLQRFFHRRARIVAIACVSFAASVASIHPLRAATPPPGFTETVLVTTHPTTGAPLANAAAYQPDTGDLWVLELGDGSVESSPRVRVRDAVSGAVATALTLDCVDSRGERGLLGIAFAPDFSTSRHVFLFYIRRLAAAGTCSVPGEAESSRFRVSRFTESGHTLGSETVLLEGPALSGATNHNAGTLRFAPDGTLFVSTGDNDTDAAANPLSRDLSSLQGKLLRIAVDGSVPSDNPFVGEPGVRPEIWAWGLRNPFRFSVDPGTGAPIIADVGERTWEAVYLGVAGADYGYPCVEGVAPFRTCNPDPPAGSVTDPIFVYGHADETPPVSGNSITGGPVYDHPAFPSEYAGAYFFGDYVDGWIRRGRITAAGELVDVEMFVADAAAVTDIIVSPAGCLTWVGLFGGVREICHAGGDNGQPRAESSAAPSSGTTGLTVQFTGSESSDPDGDPLLYSWDLGDGSSSGLADPSHLYGADGVYEAVLEVDDQQGEANSIDGAPPLRIVVGNRAPAAAIANPAPNTLYNAGDTILFSGGATDAEDGDLGADRLSWTAVFHHDTHTHPFRGPISGIASGQFTIPASGEDAVDVFYRLHLSARDSGAPLGPDAELSSSVFVDLLPSVATITLETDPSGAGLDLELDHQSMPAPFALESVSGFPRTLGAPSPQAAAGQVFVFDAWSTGEPAEHTIVTPAADTTYTATYTVSCTGTDLVLSSDVVDTAEEFTCVSISVGPDYVVTGSGELALAAGEAIRLGNGFVVESGGRFAAAIVPIF